MKKGKFITFEGIDGCGKSSQSRRLHAVFNPDKISNSHILTREPGGSPGAEEIRRLLVEGEPGRWSPETEILLFKAARRDHLERTVWPRLEQGRHVISDRFADSTRVYQGVARGDLRELVDKLHDIIIGQEPDLTIIIDVDPKVVLQRTAQQLSSGGEKETEHRFEDFGLQFQHDLRAGFKSLAEEYVERCVLIDGHKSEDEVFAEVKRVVQERLQIIE